MSEALAVTKKPQMRTYYDADSQTFYEEEFVPHPETDCAECIFIPEKRAILGLHCSQELKERCRLGLLDGLLALSLNIMNEKKVLELGYFTMPGWSGHLMFYLFFCPVCEEARVDYVHGYRARLDCDDCGFRFHARGERFFTQNDQESPYSKK